MSLFDDEVEETTSPGIDPVTKEALESLQRVQRQALTRANEVELLLVKKKSNPRMPKVAAKG